jgi:hypothetical protein
MTAWIAITLTSALIAALIALAVAVRAYRRTDTTLALNEDSLGRALLSAIAAKGEAAQWRASSESTQQALVAAGKVAVQLRGELDRARDVLAEQSAQRSDALTKLIASQDEAHAGVLRIAALESELRMTEARLADKEAAWELVITHLERIFAGEKEV